MNTDNILYWMRLGSAALAKHGDSGTSLELLSAHDAVITLISQRDALVEALKGLMERAEFAMDKADNDGSEFDIDRELEPSRAAIAACEATP